MPNLQIGNSLQIVYTFHGRVVFILVVCEIIKGDIWNMAKSKETENENDDTFSQASN